jgi:hypothetical protein
MASWKIKEEKKMSQSDWVQVIVWSVSILFILFGIPSIQSFVYTYNYQKEQIRDLKLKLARLKNKKGSRK